MLCVDKETRTCVCGRACCRSSACCIGCGRSCGNMVRSIPLTSILGFILCMGGAGVAYDAFDDFVDATKDTSLGLHDYDEFIIAAIWSIAFVDTLMLVQGIFSTGKPREWCCSKRAGRNKTKFGCRAVCRKCSMCTYLTSWVLMMILVVTLAALAMIAWGAFVSRRTVFMVCKQQVNLGADFTLAISEMYLGGDVAVADGSLAALCAALDGTDSELAMLWLGLCGLLLGQILLLLATQANSTHVDEAKQERILPKDKASSSLYAEEGLKVENPVSRRRPNKSSSVEMQQWL